MKRRHSLAKVRHDERISRRRRRHHARKHRENPMHHHWLLWALGGAAVIGGGYFAYRYFKTNFTVANGASYQVPAGSTVNLTLPAGASWTGATASDGSQLTIAVGQTTPLSLTISATAGVTYTVGWTLSGSAQSATLTSA